MPDREISILDRCSRRQIKELLALASSGSGTTRDSLVRIGDIEQLDSLLSEMMGVSGRPGGSVVRSVCSPDASIEHLIAMKSAAKRLVSEADSPIGKTSATLLYHLSVAAALGNHARNISSKDPSRLRPLYRYLAAELPDKELAAAFEKAVAFMPCSP